jgi:hypothetical protein
LLFKLLRKMVILGLAGFGAYKAWELVSARAVPVRDHAARVGNRLVSVVQQAESDVKDASHDAVGSVVDASRIAVAEVADAVADSALGGSSETASASNS